jgi:hypothetical protein
MKKQSVKRFLQTFIQKVYEEQIWVRKNHLRKFQLDCVETHIGKPYSITVAGPGAGKTTLAKGMATSDIVRSNFTRKQLFCAPQTHLARSFGGVTHLVLPEHVVVNKGNRHLLASLEREDIKGKTFYHFDIHIQNQHTFTQMDGSVQALKTWLLTPVHKLRASTDPRIISGLVAVATHQTVVLAMQELKDEGLLPKAFENLSLFVDEAHHISDLSDWGDDDRAEGIVGTKLGVVCTDLLSSGVESANLHLLTATPFRNDGREMVSKAIRGDFSHYKLDFLTYWGMTQIASYENSYIEHALEGDPLDDVYERIAAEPERYSIVFVPSINAGWRRNDPDGERLAALFKRLRKLFPVDPKTKLDPVLDLVKDEGREAQKARLLKEPQSPSEGTPSVRVVVSCQIGREGLDIPFCDRLYCTTIDNSVTRSIQTAGRTWRNYHPKKKDVKVISYYSEFSLDDENREDKLNGRMNALLMAMHHAEMFDPLVMPKVQTPPIPGQQSTQAVERVTGESSAKDQIGWAGWHKCLREVIGQNEREVQMGRVCIRKAQMLRIMEKHGIKKDHDLIASTFYRKIAQMQNGGSFDFARRVLSEDLIRELDEAGFRQLQEATEHTSLLTYEGEYGMAEQQRFRRIVDAFIERKKTTDERIYDNNFNLNPKEPMKRTALRAQRRRLKKNAGRGTSARVRAISPSGHKARAGRPGDLL